MLPASGCAEAGVCCIYLAAVSGETGATRSQQADCHRASRDNGHNQGDVHPRLVKVGLHIRVMTSFVEGFFGVEHDFTTSDIAHRLRRAQFGRCTTIKSKNVPASGSSFPEARPCTQLEPQSTFLISCTVRTTDNWWGMILVVIIQVGKSGKQGGSICAALMCMMCKCVTFTESFSNRLPFCAVILQKLLSWLQLQSSDS